MATFRKRSGGWRAEVCIKGIRTSATFTTKREAQAWAAQEETRLREDSVGMVPNRPFRDLLERYSRDVSSKKRGAVREQRMIGVILRDPVSDVSLRVQYSGNASVFTKLRPIKPLGRPRPESASIQQLQVLVRRFTR